MAGGLLNLISFGQESLLFYGNPQKTFFKKKYKQFTNFGMQRFRLNFNGSTMLRMSEETKFTFTIPRYGDLLYECYLVLKLPDIYSTIRRVPENSPENEWVPYEFKWIREIGTHFINRMDVKAGSQLLATYTGEYFSAVAQRDLTGRKIDVWNQMTGNVPELFDPANSGQRVNLYPNAILRRRNEQNPNINTLEPNEGNTIIPSIKGRTLHIPLETWFSSDIGSAFPLISHQYNELTFDIYLKPVKELYIIRDIKDETFGFPHVSPNVNETYQQLFNFINPPEDTDGNVIENTNSRWNPDIHMISTYIFLDKQEREIFAKNSQEYLIKTPYSWEFLNVFGSRQIELDSKGLVSNYMFRFRRSDAFLRNEWSNYTNFPYDNEPINFQPFLPDPQNFITGNFIGDSETLNIPNILVDMAILLDGKFRENSLDSGVYQFIETYRKANGSLKPGLFLYSFSLDTNTANYQPSGAINMDLFEKIEFQFNTIIPPKCSDSSQFINQICDADGNVIGTRKNTWILNEYAYDLLVLEERYNILVFQNGICGLMYAR